MLRVRALHEDQAKRDAHEAELRLIEAKKQRDVKEAELERYRKWRPKEEDRRYAAIIGKPMNASALGEFRDDLARLAQGELQRLEQVQEADDVVQKRQAETDEARQQVIVARRACMKLEEHRNIWTTAMHKEEERLADLEMEEARGPAEASDES